MTDRYAELAALPFEGGYPTPETRDTLDDELYFQRATQTYLWALPAVNMSAMKVGMGKAGGGTGYHVMAVTEQRLKPNTVITTPNSDVIYGLGFANLAESGPLVIDAPPKLQALLDDFWHRPLTGPTIDGRTYLGDVGIPGPDHGEGGKYLIVPEGYDGDVPEDHFVFTSKTDGVFIFVRGFFSSNEDLTPGVASVEAITVRPLHGEALPMRFEHVSDTPADALFPRGAAYFDLLDEFIQSDRVDAVDPYMHGMLAALGIRKGEQFAPTARQRELLEAAAVTGWKMAKNIAANFDRENKGLWWSDRQWAAHALTETDDFWHTLLDEQWRWRDTGHTHVDAKAHMFVNHYSISTGMISSVPGLGAKYGGAYKDSDGEYLRGERTYRLDMPADPPARLFWSITLYDADTAAGVDAEGQTYPSLNSMNDLVHNEDGSTTFIIGPERPEGAVNWLKTVPGRGWFSLFRFYGPTEVFFDRGYKTGGFVRVDA